MDFTLPEDLQRYLAELDEFIEREIRPLDKLVEFGLVTLQVLGQVEVHVLSLP